MYINCQIYCVLVYSPAHCDLVCTHYYIPIAHCVPPIQLSCLLYQYLIPSIYPFIQSEIYIHMLFIVYNLLATGIVANIII